tara:strand:+ start:2752 stop:2940 length:189 start_codon:yes stop_codon:yes gene_type:complete
MNELHYEKMQELQEDLPEIEYYMTYPERKKFTPRIWNWFNKKYAKAKAIKHYIKAKKVRLPF